MTNYGKEFDDIVDDLNTWIADLGGFISNLEILSNHPILSKEHLTEKQKDALRLGSEWMRVYNLVEGTFQGFDEVVREKRREMALDMYDFYKDLYASSYFVEAN